MSKKLISFVEIFFINMSKQIFLFLLSYVMFVQVKAQSDTVTSGNTAFGIDGEATYTVGQLIYDTYNSSSSSVSFGVQQAFEISIALSTEEYIGINLSYTAYPNPTNDNLTLKIGNYAFEDLNYQLYDSLGRLLETQKVNDSETSISLNNLPQAVYFLNVIQTNKTVKVFKIIKK